MTTHPNFKSATIPYINGASDINIFIGDALKYQYLFERKIPSSEINNWQRRNGLNAFKLKIHEIDRLFLIERFIMEEVDEFYIHYKFIGRIDNENIFYYVYLNGCINPEKTNARGYIFICENVRVFMAYLNKDQHFKNSIYNFLLKTNSGVIVDFTKNENDYYSSFLKTQPPPFTLLNLCLEKIKNDRKYYKTSELPRCLQNFLDYKNVQDAILKRKNILPPYHFYEKESFFDDFYLPPHHYVEFCLICLDSKTRNHLINNDDYYVLEYSFHLEDINCTCSMCQRQRQDWEEIIYWDNNVTYYKIPLTIHQPNMERLCTDMLETNYCENILNFQHLFKRCIPPSERGKWWDNDSFQIHPRDIDQLYYIWNDRCFYYPHHFDALRRGYFIRVMGRTKYLLFFEMVMWTLKDDNRGGFIFLSEDASSFMYCIVGQYFKKHQVQIVNKLLNDKKIITNKLFRYDIPKVKEMKEVYYYKKYNTIKNYLTFISY